MRLMIGRHQIVKNLPFNLQPRGLKAFSVLFGVFLHQAFHGNIKNPESCKSRQGNGAWLHKQSYKKGLDFQYTTHYHFQHSPSIYLLGKIRFCQMIRFVPRSFFSLVTLQIGNGEIGFVQKKYCTRKSNYTFSPTELI